MAAFNAQTFETVQRLVYPLIATLFDFDPSGYVGDKSQLFTEIGEALDELSGLFFLAASALEDGILSEQEIAEIIAKAGSVMVAATEIGEAFGQAFGDDEEADEE